jgi:hypothetical protein
MFIYRSSIGLFTRFILASRGIPDTGNIHRPIPNRKPFTPPTTSAKAYSDRARIPPPPQRTCKNQPSHRHLLGDDVATVTPPPPPVAQGELVIGLLRRYDLPRIDAWPGGIVVTTPQLTRPGSLVQNPSAAIGAKRPADTDARSPTSVPSAGIKSGMVHSSSLRFHDLDHVFKDERTFDYIVCWFGGWTGSQSCCV